MSEINERVSILEVEFTNMKSSLESLNSSLTKNSEITLAIKERIDKQNGILPHLADSVKFMSEKQEKMMDKLAENSVRDAKNSTKLKILWGSLAALAMSLGGYLLKSIIG